MVAEPLPAVDGLEEIVETDVAVHLIMRVAIDWEVERERAVAEMERKLAALRAFAASPEYRQRFGTRPAVVRMRTPRPPPSIVETVMSDAGVEVEVEIRALPEPEMTCAICGRGRLAESDVLMTTRGWACPSCFRGWSASQAAHPPATRPGERATGRLGRAPIVVALAVLALLVTGGLLALRRWQEVKRELLAPSFKTSTPPTAPTTPTQ